MTATTDTDSSPATSTAQTDFISLEQAAEWYATLNTGNTTAGERRAWQTWLQEKPEHQRAWQHIEAVSQRFQPLRQQGEAQAALAGYKAAAQSTASRRRTLKGIAAFTGAGLLGWMGWRHTPLPDMVLAWQADYNTAGDERRTLVLQDGTHVWLNVATAVNVRYQDASRLVQLLKGEILIDTATDRSQRPFFVETHYGRLQALGTRFSVWQTEQDIVLAVYEGKVEIRTSSGQIQIVPAGQQTRFSQDSIAPLQAAEAHRQSWSRGVIVADNQTLGTLIDELRRYHRGHLGISPDIADIRVMGVYPANAERALDILANNLPIRIRKTLPWWTTVEARPETQQQ